MFLRFLSLFLIPALVSSQPGAGSVGSFASRSVYGLTSGVLKNEGSDDGKKNFVFSPLSVFLGLTMVYEGLGEASQRTLARELGLPQDVNSVRKDIKQIAPNKVSNEDDPLVYSAFVVVDEEAEIKQAYGNAMVDFYSAQSFRFPFSSGPEKAKNILNRKVSTKTKGKISNLLPEGSISSMTKIVLINTLYFKADWAKRMDIKLQDTFTLQDGSTEEIGFVSADTLVRHNTIEGNDVLEVPLVEDNYAMVFVLPNVNSDLDKVLDASMDANSRIASAVLNSESELEEKIARIDIPEVKIETSAELKADVKNLYPGSAELFSGDADFSGMAQNPEGLYIDEIYHKAVIEFSETGVEASAATGITINTKIALQPDLELKLNRPFLFYLVDKSKKTVLFAGKLEDPSEK